VRGLAFFLAAVLAIEPTWTQVAGEQPKFRREPGVWSVLSVDLSARSLEGPFSITSPDSEKLVVIRNHYQLAVLKRGKELAVPDEAGVHPLAELLWASNSRAFAITQSDGGIVGGWFVDVYLVSDVDISQMNVTEQVKKNFMMTYKCLIPEEPTANEQPNIAALKWLNGSSKLLLVAEVPPHSSCPEMGKLMGYVVSIPSGRVLQRYEERELRKTWSRVFGERLSTK